MNPQGSIVAHVTRAREEVCVWARGIVMCATHVRTSSKRDLMSSTWRQIGRFPPVAEIGDSSLSLFFTLFFPACTE